MKKTLLFSFIVLSFVKISFAQGIVSRIPARPFVPENSSNMEGTPYLANDFTKGTFYLADGKSVENMLVKLNLYKEMVTYKDEKGMELLPTDPINKFTIEENGKVLTFQKGFPAIEKFDASTYYEVLNKKGIPMVLKKRTKTLLSRREYNSSKVTDNYLDGTKYFVFDEASKISKLKTDKNSLALYFPNKQNEVAEYISKEKLSLKNDDDLAKIFDYYI
ncbi:MAG: hypothetical protein EOO43_13330, partial [Flavobacterium sp.]